MFYKISKNNFQKLYFRTLFENSYQTDPYFFKKKSIINTINEIVINSKYKSLKKLKIDKIDHDYESCRKFDDHINPQKRR